MTCPGCGYELAPFETMPCLRRGASEANVVLGVALGLAYVSGSMLLLRWLAGPDSLWQALAAAFAADWLGFLPLLLFGRRSVLLRAAAVAIALWLALSGIVLVLLLLLRAVCNQKGAPWLVADSRSIPRNRARADRHVVGSDPGRGAADAEGAVIPRERERDGDEALLGSAAVDLLFGLMVGGLPMVLALTVFLFELSGSRWRAVAAPASAVVALLRIGTVFRWFVALRRGVCLPLGLLCLPALFLAWMALARSPGFSLGALLGTILWLTLLWFLGRLPSGAGRRTENE